MGVWKNLYLTSLLLLGLVVLGSLAYVTYNTVINVNEIKDKANSETLIRIPPVETFLGRPISSVKIEEVKKADYDKMTVAQQFTYNVRGYLAFYGNSIPMILLIATIFMVLTIFTAFMLRGRLVAVDESKRNFESLMEAIFGYGAFVLGIVFSWSNYTNLFASVNSRSSDTAFTYDAGRAIADQVVSNLSVGLIVAFFGVALCLYAVVRGFQIYRRLDSREAVYTYRSTAPFARQHAR
jgi:hypothetical protein